MKQFSKPIIALVCLCVLSISHTAFGQGLAKKITGKWTGNVELTKKYWEKNGMEDTQRLLDRIPKTSISFLKDGKLVVGMETPDGVAREITGKYTVEKTDEAKKELTLKFIPTDENAPPEVEVLIKIQGDGKQTSLVITPDNDPPVVFAKAKKSAKGKAEKKKSDSPKKEVDKKDSNK